MRVTFEVALGSGRASHSTLEIAAPARRRMIQQMGMLRIETLFIGTQAWNRAPDGTWRPSSNERPAFERSSAVNLCETVRHAFDAPAVTVTREPASSDLRVFHVVAPSGSLPGGGTLDARFFVRADGLPDHVDATLYDRQR